MMTRGEDANATVHIDIPHEHTRTGIRTDALINYTIIADDEVTSHEPMRTWTVQKRSCDQNHLFCTYRISLLSNLVIIDSSLIHKAT